MRCTALPARRAACGNVACDVHASYPGGQPMLRIFLWIIGVIFLIGLLVVTGFFKLIF